MPSNHHGPNSKAPSSKSRHDGAHYRKTTRDRQQPLGDYNHDIPIDVDGDTVPAERVRELVAELQQAKAQLAANVNSSHQSAPTTHTADAQVPNESILTSQRASKVHMAVIRDHLGYEKPKWNALRTFIRDTLMAA
ncbi:hypothetical protein MVEN_00044500 [Mycena venus]|uniref:Uncharacterized protein n=1 Tax=Mycena venus TaxID=2733690 RepID=A0A8H6Z3X4_9AGAR|nr:hypothetical protein MVEN_00044500 [Mycena venus]